MVKMDLGQDKKFVFKHPYLFKEFSFDFVGLKPEEKWDFEFLTTSMGAKICNDAEYVLTDILPHPSSHSKNYYSISYVLDSLKAGTPLNIDDYKFANLIPRVSQSEFCCADAKFIWKNKSCLSYYLENICCNSCRIRELRCDQVEEGDKEPQCANNCESNGELQCENIGYLKTESQCVNIGVSNKQISSWQAGQSNTYGVSAENGAYKRNSAFSDVEIEQIEIHKNLEEASYSTQVSQDPKASKQSSTDQWIRLKKSSHDSDINNKNEHPCSSLEKRRRVATDSNSNLEEPIRQQNSRSSSPSTEMIIIESSSDCEYVTSSDESPQYPASNEDFLTWTKNKEWWLTLPTPPKKNRMNCKRLNYENYEDKIMITYLIVKNLIDHGTSREPWAQILEDGFLKCRSTESINTHFRKFILPNIESFKLPSDIEEQFINCRKCHIGRK